ncbi:DNA repair protein rad16 [Entomortierella beljakovae]|nr:DNA repair protein rad16 [Entomortierella beljakovae]
MPPKKSTSAPPKVSRPTRQTRSSATVSNSSNITTDASESVQNSRINSISSSPNSSFSLSKLNIDSDHDSDMEKVDDNDEQEDQDEDDFMPSNVVTLSSNARGKRRLADNSTPIKNEILSRSIKRTRNSRTATPSAVKAESSDEEKVIASDPEEQLSDEPSTSTSTNISVVRRKKVEEPTVKTEPPGTSTRKTVRAASKKATETFKAQMKKEDSSSSEDEDDEDVKSSGGESSDSSEELEEEDSVEDSSEPEAAPVARIRRRRAPRSQLTWMEKVNLQLLTFHPELGSVWDELDKVKVHVPEPVDQPEGLQLKLLPFQREGLGWMMKQENSEFKGGILADEMGMGKTIQMISLLLSQPGKPNLIIAPTVAIVQWMSEVASHAPSLTTHMFHGPNRTESIKLLTSFDIVITTYSIIESGYRKQKYGVKRGGMTVKEDSILHRIKWNRIILDEAHNIKERSCNTARSAFALQSERKWCLSGTPMQNRVGELYSLIRFMEADPFGYYYCKKCPCKSLHWRYSNMKDCDDCGHRPMDHVCWWNNEILKPIQNYGNQGVGEKAFAKLRSLLDRIMLRRTKVERADDLGLPPRKLTVSRYLFNEEEEDLYESLFSDSKRKFSTYVEQNTVLNNYANIFELLTKMRQMVDHPDLVLKKIKPGQVGLPETLVCSICQEEAEDPIVSKCHHLFCREDAQQYISTAETEAPECPVCHIPLSIDLQQSTYVREDNDAAVEVRHKNFARTSIVNRIDMNTWRSSTKIEALVEQLYSVQREDRSTKSICFSQYVTFLDLIKWRLEKAGFKCVKLDGHMTPAMRAASIKKFSEDPTVTVFLISLKAGGVALNLTAASRVFICDPWWNPAAELQAMDRIHRIGQHRPILVTRIIIENSIESRILQLQEKKQAMVDSTIGKDPAALSKLTTEDLRFLFVN